MSDTIEVETGPKPDAAVIWLHGLGADGHDFEPIVPELVRGRERAWRFVFPNAPIRPVTINGGMPMRAWYDIRGLDRRATEDVAGFRHADAIVRELIQRETGRGIPSERIVLAGFSQGGAVSLYSAPRLSTKLAGVMVLSAYMSGETSFDAERSQANDATALFMAHGREDGTLNIDLGRQARDFMKGHDYAVEWHEYSMGHSVCPEEVADIREFLFSMLP